jgi:hypothetical protein
MTRYVWVMNYPSSPGSIPEIVDEDGKTIEALPKQPTYVRAVEKLREWAKTHDGKVILMPSGEKL